MLDRPVRLIVNPHAAGGRAARRLPGVEAALRGLGLPFAVERTCSMEHARELARAARGGGELVAVMGGDGITGAVAGELAGSETPLAILPGGRGNDFARKLGIPPDPAEAVELLARGRERRVDVAEIDGRGYLGILSAGLDSDANAVANATRLPLGTFVYAYGALRALSRWRPARWELTVDGSTRAFSGYAVAVANSGIYGGGMRLVPGAVVDDGLLDVLAIGDRPKRRYLAALPKVFCGRHLGEPGIAVLRGREITLRADRAFTAYADGDPIADLPVTVRVRERALRVMAP